MVKRLGLIAGLLGACIPGFHAVEGLACDAQHLCPDGLPCVENVCGADAGSAGGGAGGGATNPCVGNVFANGDFEAGPTAVALAWMATGGTLTVENTAVRTGAWAGRLTAAAPANISLSSQFGAVSANQNADYCATAWVRGVDAGTATLQLSRFETTAIGTSGTPAGSQAAPTATWQALSTRFGRTAGTIDFSLQVIAPLGPGAELDVDDVCVSLCP